MEKIKDLRKLIASDAYAISFQSIGQYRSALLREFDLAINSGLTPDTPELACAWCDQAADPSNIRVTACPFHDAPIR